MSTGDPRLDRALDGVAKDVPPARDLWPGIAARLEPRDGVPDASATPASAVPAAIPATPRTPARRRAWTPRLLAIAASLGFVALSAAISWELSRRSLGGHPPALASRQEGAASAPATGSGAVVPVAANQLEYERTRRELEATFNERLALLAPETRARVLENLEIIRRAEADIRSALEADPASRVLQQLQQSTRRQEIDLYTTIGLTTEPALTRTTT